MKKSVKIALGAIATILCLMCLATATIVYLGVSVYQARRLFEEAARAMSRRDYEIAISKFRAALGKHLDKTYRPYALGDLAFCESSDGRCEAALRDYTEALRVDPKLAWAYENRGSLYTESAETDRALADFSNALQLDPNLYYSHFKRGLIEMDRKDIEGALEDFAEAARINPSAAAAYYNRGVAYSLKKDYERALANLDAAIQISPNYAAALTERGYIYSERLDLDKAVADLSKAIRIEPRASAYRTRGFALKDLKRWNEAISDFNKALQLNANDTSALNGRAMTYSLMGEQDRALADFSTILEHWNVGNIYSSRGYAYARKRNYERALADFREGVKLMPQDDFTLNSLAWFLSTCPDAKFRNGNEAVAIAMKACTLSQWREANLVDTLAAAYAENGNFKEAVAYEIKAMSYDKLDQTRLDGMQKRRRLYEQGKPYRELKAE
ncbi:MAG: hypothetical protein DME57_04090 [Verrucomicrobia bacterium]|nr:MAG: hypothetical protein DME57_04090 [Verrucomicrobiota bacterium]